MSNLLFLREIMSVPALKLKRQAGNCEQLYQDKHTNHHSVYFRTVQDLPHNLCVWKQNKSSRSSADFSSRLCHFLISSLKEACRKLHWRTDTAVRF